ncbi:MAG: Calx-beta domain-containing protein [Pseudomonadota bacterium]
MAAGETVEVGFQGVGSAEGLDLIDTTMGIEGGGGDAGDGGMGSGGDGGMGDGGSGGGSGQGGAGSGGGSGPFVGGGTTYQVGQIAVVTGFDPTRDVLDLGPPSIHNQIPVDTPDGFMMLHMFNPGFSTLVEGVWLADLHPENFAPIADGHLQQDMSAILAYEDGSGLVRPNTVYARSHEEGVVEVVDFDPATDKLSFFYLSVRGDGGLNFRAEQTAEGARFWNPLTGQSLTLRDVDFADLDSSHFEWRANQLEDGIAGRMGLEALIDGFSYPPGNVFSGKSVAMAGLVDRAPYHSQPDYTGTPIGAGSDDGGTGDGGSSGGGSGGDGSGGDGSGDAPVVVTVTGGSVTEADPGMAHVHGDGSSHMHDDGHRYITFTVSLEAPAAQELRLTYATADVTAVADATSSVAWDYHAASGELVFAPGDRTKTVAVAVHPDTLVEDTETFSFQVSGENLTGTLEATGTIYDDDVHDVPPLIAQAGETAFVQQGADAWTQVLFDAAMVDPIVTLGPLSRKGAHEATLRVRNVTSHGFEIQVDEWDHLDGWHTGETVSWLAVERGTHRLADGAMLQAGRSDASHDWTRIDFDAGFADVMVLGSVSSDRTPNAVTERFRDLSADGVSVALQKQEASDGTTAVESFDWVAFELGGFDAFTAVRDGTTVNDAHTAVTLDAPLADDQAFFAEMQTTRGKDAATLRLNAFDGQTATLFVEEETSRDDEKRHLHEEIAWLTIDDAIHAAGHAAAPPDPGGMEATLFHFDEIKSGAYVASDNAEFPEITATTHLVQSNDFGRAGYDGHDWGGIDPNMYRGFDYAGRDREIGEAVGAGPVIQVDPGMSTQQIEDAIDAAPAGATVEFLDGTYWLTETLNIDRGDLHVKGQSEAGVILRADAVTDDAAIRVSDGIRAKLTPDEVKLATEATAPVSAEDRSVVLTSVAGIEPGDFIEFVYNYDADLNTRVDVGDSFNKLSSLVEVAMVHPEMNMVMLREKAGMDYDPNRSVGNSEVRVYDKDDFIHDLVISDLTIRYADDAEYQSTVDPHDLFNYNNQNYGGDYAHKVAGIRLEGVHETDVVNVTVDNAASLGIWIDAGYQVGIPNFTFDGAQNLGGGGNGYGILLDDSFYGDFEGLTMGRTDADGNIYATRHAVVFGYSSSGAYNNTQIDFTNSNIDFHGAADYGNIYYVQEMDMVRMDHYNFGAMDDRFALDGLRYNQIQNTYVFDDVRAHEEGPIPGYVGSLVPGQEDGQGHWANNGIASPYEDVVYMSAAGGEARTFGKDDEIHGGVGADSLWGGDGDDDFLMYADSGVDAIHDFEDGDRVGVASNVNGAGIFDAGDVAARLAQVGDDAMLDLGGGNHVLLIGVQSASLSPQDFFVF